MLVNLKNPFIKTNFIKIASVILMLSGCLPIATNEVNTERTLDLYPLANADNNAKPVELLKNLNHLYSYHLYLQLNKFTVDPVADHGWSYRIEWRPTVVLEGSDVKCASLNQISIEST